MNYYSVCNKILGVESARYESVMKNFTSRYFHSMRTQSTMLLEERIKKKFKVLLLGLIEKMWASQFLNVVYQRGSGWFITACQWYHNWYQWSKNNLSLFTTGENARKMFRNTLFRPFSLTLLLHLHMPLSLPNLLNSGILVEYAMSSQVAWSISEILLLSLS